MTTTPDTPADLHGIATEFIDVDGVAVHVAHVGVGPAGTAVSDRTVAAHDPDATTGVLLLHHFYGNVATWRRVLGGLDVEQVPAIAVDRPGFGWTQRLPARQAQAQPINPYTRAFAVRAAQAAVAHAGFDRVVVVGSSMGGTIALEMAGAWPANGPTLSHLVLLSPALTGDVGMPPPLRPLLRGPRVTRAMRPLVRRLSRRIDLPRVTSGWHHMGLANQSDVDAYAIPIAHDRFADGIWQVMTVESPPRLIGTARGLDVPATVVSPRHDRTISPRWNRRTAGLLDAELVEVDSGHTPQEEAPGPVVDLLVNRVQASAALDRI